MDGQGIDKFLETSLALLSADVFSHPIWQHACITSPAESERLAGELQSEEMQLIAQEDWLDACRVSLASAFLQNLAGNPQSALEHLRSAGEMAHRCGLTAVVIWVEWGTSAVCAQAGDYHQAGEYLQRLQHDLYSENQWVLADVIDLVGQSLADWSASGHRPDATATDRTGLLIEQLLCWGKPPEAEPHDQMGSHTVLSQPGRQGFWRTLFRFLRGELRLELVEVNGDGSTLAAPKIHESVLPLDLPTPKKIMTPDTHLPDPSLAAVPPVDVMPVTASGDTQPAADGPDILITGSQAAEDSGKQSGLRSRGSRLRLHTGAVEQIQAPMLKACMLGSFRVELGGAVIDSWPSGRSKAVFAYLLAHHSHPVSRDVLMDTFWPETTAESARNNLNVAVYNLRHTLKNLFSAPVILLHESTAYQFNPDLRLWLDITLFEQAAREGRQRESTGTIEAAIRLYHEAVDLYQGDFLADTPFEGWTTMERERLRVLYLEILDHLSMIYFNQNKHDECIGLCQRIIIRDACREDAHARLMRCYARQGQTHLAMRQFQACLDALRDELDVPPSPMIVQLCEQIKRQESV